MRILQPKLCTAFNSIHVGYKCYVLVEVDRDLFGITSTDEKVIVIKYRLENRHDFVQTAIPFLYSDTFQCAVADELIVSSSACEGMLTDLEMRQ